LILDDNWLALRCGSLEAGVQLLSNRIINLGPNRMISLPNRVLSRRPYNSIRIIETATSRSHRSNPNSRKHCTALGWAGVQLNSISVLGEKKTRRSWGWSKSNPANEKDVEMTIRTGLSSLTQPQSSTRLWTTRLLCWVQLNSILTKAPILTLLSSLDTTIRTALCYQDEAIQSNPSISSCEPFITL
jgi:hypothetical protein